MKKFTEVYEKAHNVIKNQQFSGDWQEFLFQSGFLEFFRKRDLAGFLAEKGFSISYKKVPDRIREQIKKQVQSEKKKSGDIIYDAASNNKSSGTLLDRAATLKMVKHVYLASQKGGQNVWVYSPPKDDTGWVFDEIAGNELTVKARLSREDEIFSAKEMGWMSDALKLSLKISEDVKWKLANKSMKEQEKNIVKKWFLDEDCDDDDLKQAINTLHNGFKKISNCCNNSTLVFTDYPDWRAQRDKYFGAAFRGGEGGAFPVIYLEGAFTRLTGNTGKKWLCAETIIHEMSHHELSTEDHRYDHHGLKPNKAAFPYAKAITNADSWGYFALDLAGYLSNSDSNNVWK